MDLGFESCCGGGVIFVGEVLSFVPVLPEGFESNPDFADKCLGPNVSGETSFVFDLPGLVERALLGTKSAIPQLIQTNLLLVDGGRFHFRGEILWE